MFEVTEVPIAQLRAALESGQTTSVELVQAYLARIEAYDGPDTATALNAAELARQAARLHRWKIQPDSTVPSRRPMALAM